MAPKKAPAADAKKTKETVKKAGKAEGKAAKAKEAKIATEVAITEKRTLRDRKPKDYTESPIESQAKELAKAKPTKKTSKKTAPKRKASPDSTSAVEVEKPENVEEPHGDERVEEKARSTKTSKKTKKENGEETKPSKITKRKDKAASVEPSNEDEPEPHRKQQKDQEEDDNLSGASEDLREEPKVSKVDKKTKATKAPLNSTETKWSELDFKCEKSNSHGKTFSTLITSWNVSGLRSCLAKGGLQILDHAKSNILCLQEIKTSEIPPEIKALDVKYYFGPSKQSGYAGVAVISKITPIGVTYGIGNEDLDEDGRCITLEFEKFYLVNVYVPNAGRKLVTLPKRLEWNEAFKAFVKKLDEKKPVIVCGDLNVAHEEIDLANPKTNHKNAGFTKEEREGMSDFLADGYVDTFRHFYPDRKGAYTFWTYMANARKKNVGWRLDYFLTSERILGNVCDHIIHDQVLGSDHCPISLYFDL